MLSFERPDERVAKDPPREHRIEMEIIVDCYDEVECASGWHAYLEDHLAFPFTARCDRERSVSPLRVGETVLVTEMADIDDCMSEMFVQVELEVREFGVPLAQLVGVDVDAQTDQAIQDWHYWDQRGYQIG
ncbi:MAG: calcium-binding protein [Rubricoccaceae bacterium]